MARPTPRGYEGDRARRQHNDSVRDLERRVKALETESYTYLSPSFLGCSGTIVSSATPRHELTAAGQDSIGQYSIEEPGLYELNVVWAISLSGAGTDSVSFSTRKQEIYPITETIETSSQETYDISSMTNTDASLLSGKSWLQWELGEGLVRLGIRLEAKGGGYAGNVYVYSTRLRRVV